ncbi:MAS3 protein [Eremomyces bilateralis CBS 781.70]|uniref:MAS3 protein n=1 Tax=Eremomyces bilateralis CBS 781.70 TaxID=1392243 RepID=A0A6G1GBA7_9PEZI|nr:MAS3 protein [Eremomyces bilateralis CBS 781.70]KAF1815262.1 MAS3 protein [Eremomyces bilateralis CBS 781.70]
MHYSIAIILGATAAYVSAHGLVTEIQGANGVTMPGLTVIDGTPRDCSSNGCGSQADTAIIRTREVGGRASALGRTQGGGPVDAAAAISMFMTGQAGGNQNRNKRQLSQLLGGLRGKGKGKGKGTRAQTAQGAQTANTAAEGGVAQAAGSGATSGLPTTDDNGLITMNFRQVNQDGAGPLTAAIDPTSGGTDATAFQDAQVAQDVPGLGFGGLSGATIEDFPLTVQMPQGMTCQGSAGGADNVCIVRVQNSALAGPFGGSAAFTQSPAAQKRAVEYNLRKRHMARGILGKDKEA